MCFSSTEYHYTSIPLPSKRYTYSMYSQNIKDSQWYSLFANILSPLAVAAYILKGAAENTKDAACGVHR